METGQDLAARGGRGRRMTGSSDPRAVRTRQKLVDAFHAAIADADLDAVSVTSLARTAGINRTSFYSHFASPEDLALHALSELFDVVARADIVMRASHDVPAAEASRRSLGDIVWFVNERRESYARVLGPGAAPRLMRRVTEAFTERTVASLALIETRPAGVDVAVTARFVTCGVLAVIGAWLGGEGSSRTPEELVDALVQCLPGWLNAD
jgi:AcrR family transcriptional regulator